MPENSPEKAPGTFSLLGTASTMGLHMVSGPIVGGGLGYLIDGWLDSWPVASAIGFLIGIAAGFRNVWADARHLERSNALIDAEKKKEEEAAGKSSVSFSPKKKTGAEPERADEPEFVRLENARLENVRLAEREAEVFTASVLAGTASSEERGLEEQDETEEAIRRILQGEDPLVPKSGGEEKKV